VPHLPNIGSKWDKPKLGKLEVLQAEGDAYDRYAKKHANDNMRNGKFPSEKEKPDDIQKQSSCAEIPKRDFPSKRPQYKYRDFKTLEAEGNADYSQTQYKSCDKPQYRCNYTSKQKPNYISQ
jgi:hypothetical protein